ncbi:MAG: hypothetical protein AAF748_10365 [Pseudomonadota bacterium]
MQKNRGGAFAAAKAWHQVMAALARIRRDRALAQRTDWIGFNRRIACSHLDTMSKERLGTQGQSL